MIIIIGLIFLVIISFGCLLSIFVFCFWFIYLLDAIKSKWKFYRNALRCLQQENFDSQQQIIVYNAKTEFVKNVFLFFMNFTELLTLIFICVAFTISTTTGIMGCNLLANVVNNTSNSSQTNFSNCIFQNQRMNLIPFVGSIFITFAHNCAVLSMLLIASLCNYLANRFSRYSFLSSNYIPNLIFLCIPYQIVSQIIASFCSFLIIAKIFNLFLLTVSMVVALKQYKKLLMVISWTIVDMAVSCNHHLLKKQIKMKQKFTRIFTSIWLGILLVTVYQYLESSLIICWMVFRSYSLPAIDFSMCWDSHFPPQEIADILSILSTVIQMLLVTGLVLSYSPYICYGLSTMCVVLRRLLTGQSGYKTHYYTGLYTSLV